MNPDDVMELLPQTRSLNKFLLAFLLICFYCYSLAAMEIGSGWIFGDWQFAFLFALIPVIAGVVIGILAIILALIGFVQRRRGKLVGQDQLQVASALRAGFDQAHETYLPVIAIQPERLLNAADVQKRLRLRWLPNVAMAPMAINRWRMLWIITSLAQIFTPFLFVHALQDYPFGMTTTLQQAQDYSELLFVILVVFLIMNVFVYSIALFNIKKYRITADHADIRWQRFGRWVVVPWRSVQAIGAYTHPQSFPQDFTTTYVIAASDRLIIWKNTPGLSVGNYQNSADLLRLAVTQTGMPVRNLNPLVTALAVQSAEIVAHTLQPQVFDDPQGLLARAADFLRAELARQRHPARRLCNVAVIALVAILATLPLLVENGLHDVVQPHYFATLPARIHAKTPLFSDSLRAADGHWPVQSPTLDDYRHLAYSAQGYSLTGNITGKEIYAVMPNSYGPVAIQVTATETGIIPPNTYDGVGIIMRGNASASDPLAASDYCTFSVNYHGDWRVACGFLGSLVGHSAAIHTGPGATDTLLVIARGNQYICYVNGQYVGQFFDRFSDNHSLGQVGVVNVESGMQATFTDFTVWSVTAPPNLDYV